LNRSGTVRCRRDGTASSDGDSDLLQINAWSSRRAKRAGRRFRAANSQIHEGQVTEVRHDDADGGTRFIVARGTERAPSTYGVEDQAQSAESRSARRPGGERFCEIGA
jgi:hypothetical protein